MLRSLLPILLLGLPLCAPASDLPDPTHTPGAINLAVTQQNIQETICVRGYTKTIRPPAHFTNKLKKRQLRQYGYADPNPKHYEEDHLIALSIGGSPDDERNLWPEPRNTEWNAEKKDQLEFVLYKMVCGNEISLGEAQREMAGNWIEAWKKYVPSHRYYRFRGRVD
jgi:hypothetical protein